MIRIILRNFSRQFSYFERKLKLKLHPNKVSIRKYRQGIDFLGYVALRIMLLLERKQEKNDVEAEE